MNTRERDKLRTVAFGSWYGFLGLGLGSGLSPRAPGTVGSLVGLVLMLLIIQLPDFFQWAWLCGASSIGVIICSRCGKALGAHDHGAIVWDEFVGVWWVLMFIPVGLQSWALGFALFRLFDIAKPWPIRWLDRHVTGGAGVMVDDVVAAVFAIISWWLLNHLWLTWWP